MPRPVAQPARPVWYLLRGQIGNISRPLHMRARGSRQPVYRYQRLRPKICVYTLTTETGSIEPTAVEAHLELTDDTAPENRWAYDIITDEGKTKLRAVVMDIKSMVANI
ncbi:hypothetical protein OG21DRAFT_1495925 [Imleria badia]|nr:hypothetical protein OG21DRAFT_1495925 [Imleria badia]